MDRSPEFDTVLNICGHKHRRIVLAALANQEQPISINGLTDAIIEHNHHLPLAETSSETVTEIQTELHHVHLPKLTDAGFLRYDSERKVVEPKAQVGREDSHLSAILAMDSELPTTC